MLTTTPPAKKIKLLEKEIEKLENELDEVGDFVVQLLIDLAHQMCVNEYWSLYKEPPPDGCQFPFQMMIQKLVDYGLPQEDLDDLLQELANRNQ